MKNYLKYFLFISSLLLIVSGCAKKDDSKKRREVAKEIDTELVQKLSGVWLGEGEKENNVYDISYEKKELRINGEKLEITSTDNNWVKSQTKSEKIFFYDFEIEGDTISVYPSFPVDKGQVGGVLAPIKLKSIASKEIEVHDSNTDEVRGYEEELKAILSKYEAKEPFSLKIKQYTHEGDPIIEMITFDGSIIYYYRDNSKDKFGEKEMINTKYIQLKYVENESDNNVTIKQFVLFDPISKESEKEVVFDIKNVE